MPSQHLFLIAILVGLIVSLVFLYPRQKQDPSRLKMDSAKDKRDSKRDLATKTGFDGSQQISPEARMAQQDQDRLGFDLPKNSSFDESFDRSEAAKSLNVYFNYNGHTWDAFEVLGLPAGAPIAMAEAKFAEEVKKVTHQDSREFLLTAIHAIRTRK